MPGLGRGSLSLRSEEVALRERDAFVPQDLSISALYPHSRHLSPTVRAFVDFLSQRFGPRPYWDLAEADLSRGDER